MIIAVISTVNYTAVSVFVQLWAICIAVLSILHYACYRSKLAESSYDEVGDQINMSDHQPYITALHVIVLTRMSMMIATDR